MHQMYSKFSKFPATDKIRVLTSMHQMYSKFSKFSSTDRIWVSAFTLLGLGICRYRSDGYYDIYDDPRYVSDGECKVLTSLSRVQFEDLVGQISESGIRNSSNRSIRTATAILLIKLRFGMSNTLLAVLFQLPHKRIVSRCNENARKALMNGFVAKNLGFSHIGRNEIIYQHTLALAQYLMCKNEPNTAILVVDSTYIYIYPSK